MMIFIGVIGCFVAARTVQQSVAFSDHPVDRKIHIWEGYIKAGNALIDAACNLGVYDRGALTYPILFNYRHSLELAMKTIVNEYGGFSRETPLLKGHDLWRVWK